MSYSPLRTTGRLQEPFRFGDRHHAGSVLASQIRHLAARKDVVVLARKLGLPAHPELAMGAIASGGVRVMNEDVVIRHRPTVAAIEAVTRAERIELERRERAYRNGQPAVSCGWAGLP